jgi:hypothetical protein
MEYIFPSLGRWNTTVCDILKQEYPPQKSSENIGNDEIERDKNRTFDFSKLTIWELICTEAIDTEYSHVYYTGIYEEILKRGISVDELKRAREFMWLTAGWLNFELMFWNWISLDENDIKKAIDLQFERHLITGNKKEIMYKYIDKIKELERKIEKPAI